MLTVGPAGLLSSGSDAAVLRRLDTFQAEVAPFLDPLPWLAVSMLSKTVTLLARGKGYIIEIIINQKQKSKNPTRLFPLLQFKRELCASFNSAQKRFQRTLARKCVDFLVYPAE